MKRLGLVLFSFAGLLALCGGLVAHAAPTPIRHVIIVLQENRTFDNLFHGYSGANYATTGETSGGHRIPLHPVHLMVPYDAPHHYRDWVTEYNGGLLDGFDRVHPDSFAATQHAPRDFVYSYVMQSDVQPYWDLAQEGVLADEMFADHRSQSFGGHLYPIAGASGPIDAESPDYYASGGPVGGESCANPGIGPAINLITGIEDRTYTSCLDIPTLADLLDKRHLSWKFYTPFSERTQYLSSFSVISRIYHSSEFARNVVSPETTILEDAQRGTLPAVSWVIGTYANSDHAGQRVASSNGPTWVTTVFNAIGTGPQWKSSVILLVYDDWGGWYDHVKPTTFNAFEPGFRVPLVVVSPYAKRGYISHRTHYVGSMLHFIEKNWALGSLHRSDARADALEDCFDYTQAPLPYLAVRPTGPIAQLFESDLDWYDRHPSDPDAED